MAGLPRSPSGRLRRFPPARAVPEHDTSLLGLLFRGARFPDTEWWWNSIHLIAKSNSGERELSIITNVQLGSRPFAGELRPSAVLAVRDVRSGQRWIACSRGSLSQGRSCSFFARGWSLSRLDPSAASYAEDCLAVMESPTELAQRYPKGAYAICVDSAECRARLILGTESMARFGDRGWLDYNPEGGFPLWASSKVRLQSVEGRLRVGGEDELAVVSGNAHFEQQCLLLSASLPHLLAPGSLAEGALLSALSELAPKWHWYRVVLPAAHLCVFVMWSPRSRRTLSSFGAILDRGGNVCELEALEVAPSAYYDAFGVMVPKNASILFETSGSVDVPAGRYSVHLGHDPRVDWRVPYVYANDRTCLAHEAHCTAQVVCAGSVVVDRAPATQETIDLERSMVSGHAHV